MDKLLSAANAFMKVMKENHACGTGDSEVYYVFRELLRKAMRGQDPYVPRSADGWQLYDMPESPRVAECLHQAAVDTINAMKSCPIRYIKQVGDFVNSL